MGSLSIWHWLIVLAIVVLIFGTKKLRGAGNDLGIALKSFKEATRAAEETAKIPDPLRDSQNVASAEIIHGQNARV